MEIRSPSSNVASNALFSVLTAGTRTPRAFDDAKMAGVSSDKNLHTHTYKQAHTNTHTHTNEPDVKHTNHNHLRTLKHEHKEIHVS